MNGSKTLSPPTFSPETFTCIPLPLESSNGFGSKLALKPFLYATICVAFLNITAWSADDKASEYLKSISAKPSFIREVGSKFKLPESEIQGMIDAVEESTKTIFADAPVALGGIPKKIQYYCYIDEPRGHLYNWILNPKNKFTKYIFIAFTMSSAFSYSMKQMLDGIKDVAVLKENAKTDLDLRKRLVDVEIRNFKAKKESANAPLVDNFKKQAMSGTKTKEELKQLAENILVETKNGPPYVYA